MIERLIITLVVVAIGLLTYRQVTHRQINKAARAVVDPLLHDLAPGVPAIVYFTTPDCAPCRLQQTPTLQRLQQELAGGLQVLRVDATENPDTADRWGVFSVPTTFVLDPQGQPRSVYNGVVDATTLKKALGVQV